MVAEKDRSCRARQKICEGSWRVIEGLQSESATARVVVHIEYREAPHKGECKLPAHLAFLKIVQTGPYQSCNLTELDDQWHESVLEMMRAPNHTDGDHFWTSKAAGQGDKYIDKRTRRSPLHRKKAMKGGDVDRHE